MGPEHRRDGSVWRDHLDRPIDRPPPPGEGAPPFYAPIGDFQGSDYRRNAFTRGTEHEVGMLRERLALRAGERVLDVGCGDARHLRRLAADGIRGVGIDISGGLLRAAAAASTEDGVNVGPGGGIGLVQADARRLPVRPEAFGAAICLCHGGLGTHPATDGAIVAGLAAAVRPGGRIAFTVFHTLFAVRHLVPGDAFDPRQLVHHQVSEVRGPEGARAGFDLWTATYTAREAERLARDAGLEVLDIAGCEPGRYDSPQIRLDDPELLVVAARR